METYTTTIPIFISCPICHDVHETKEEVAKCWGLDILGEQEIEDDKAKG